MALIQDQEQLREFLRVNFINSESSLPDFDMAELVYLVPILGQELYDQVTAFQDEAAPADGAELPDRDAYKVKQLLVKACRRVVAPLAYLLELPLHQVRFSDLGLRTIATTETQAAPRWAYMEVKEHLASAGALAIEGLLQLLFSKRATFPTWEASEPYKELSGLIFRTAGDFQRYYRVDQPYRVFWTLRPLMREVQDLYLASAIGEGFLQELLEKTGQLSAEESKALELIRKAVAQLTIQRAAERLSVRVTGQGFTVLLGAGAPDAPNAGDAAAPMEAVQRLADTCGRAGDSYLLQLQEYLNAKASNTVFPTYFQSSLYTSPVVPARPSRNAGSPTFNF